MSRKQDRAKARQEKLRQLLPDLLEQVPAAGERLVTFKVALGRHIAAGGCVWDTFRKKDLPLALPQGEEMDVLLAVLGDTAAPHLTPRPSPTAKNRDALQKAADIGRIARATGKSVAECQRDIELGLHLSPESAVLTPGLKSQVSDSRPETQTTMGST